MRRALVWLGAVVAALACGALAAAPQRVDYTITPVLRDGALNALAIELSFRGDADGETDLALPDAWASESELWRGIEGLSARNATIVATDSPARRVLRHRPNARITVSYRVIQDWEGEPSAGQGNPYRPIIQPSYFQVLGETMFVFPDLAAETPARVRVRNLPRGWSYASDLEHRGLTLDAMHQSVAVGGDYRVTVRGNLRVAMRGAWAFEDTAFADRTIAILQAQRAFWGDADEPYLVTVTQLATPDQNARSIGGTGLADAFAFFATPNADDRTIARLLAHEALHTWIPRRIGGLPEENEAAGYWLSEGFTDFYTGRILVRGDLWTAEDFAADLNDMLRAYAASPARGADNATINSEFWNDVNVRSLPYQRGRLLATIWDARLRASQPDRDLDDVLLEMYRRSRAAGGEPGYATQLFAEVGPEFGLALGDDIERFVEQGGHILLPVDIFAPCGVITTSEAPVFSRGFDVDATLANNNVIAGVDPTLPAYAAGLRDGMVLVRRAFGEIGDPETEIGYLVRDGETERTIRYMPRGHGTFTLQALELAGSLDGERLTQCLGVLGGTGGT